MGTIMTRAKKDGSQSYTATIRKKQKGKVVLTLALLHKSDDCQASPFPGRIYPTGSVTGKPRAV